MLKLQKVLISDPVDESAIQILRQKGGDIQCDLRPGLPKNELIAIIKDYDALIVRSGTQVTKEVIEAGRKLKLIGRAGVGVDNIDLKAATKAGIIVINAPGGNTISAVELTCTMILSTARMVPQACASLKQGVWDRKTFVGNEIKDKTLAIIGLGRIGREVAIRMQSFGMRTIGFDPLVAPEQSKEFGVESLSLDQIWPLADFITVHTPLIPQTKNMINAETLNKCKKGVRIINVARGGIIDENDLLQALKSGHCAGAGLDVFVDEPPSNTELIKHPRVVCTPHLGASTKEAQLNVAKEIAEQFLDLINRKSVPGVVNAPLLGEMLKHENLLWIRLGKNLGRLAAVHRPEAKSFTVTVNGFQASKSSKLIKESILVGILSERTREEVNIVSAGEWAANLGIQVVLDQSKANNHCCFSSVHLGTEDGAAFVGIPQGRRPYLSEMNRNRFEPVICLEGNVSVLQAKPDRKQDIVSLLMQACGDWISSITRSQTDRALVAVHSTKPLDLERIADSVTFVNQMEF